MTIATLIEWSPVITMIVVGVSYGVIKAIYRLPSWADFFMRDRR